jgi:hypothetical protein
MVLKCKYKGLRVLQAPRGLLVLKVNPVHKVLLVIQAVKEHKVLVEELAQLVLKENRGRKENKVQRAYQDQKAHRGL